MTNQGVNSGLSFQKDILAQRSKIYAKKEEQISVKGELKQFTAFRLHNEWYLVDMIFIHEIARPARISRLPRQRDFLRGVMNMRGDIVLIADLGVLLEIGHTRHEDHSRIILMKSGMNVTGFLVDEIMDHQQFDTGEFQVGLTTIRGGPTDFIKGLYHFEGKHFVWLDMPRIFDGIIRRLA